MDTSEAVEDGAVNAQVLKTLNDLTKMNGDVTDAFANNNNDNNDGDDDDYMETEDMQYVTDKSESHIAKKSALISSENVYNSENSCSSITNGHHDGDPNEMEWEDEESGSNEEDEDVSEELENIANDKEIELDQEQNQQLSDTKSPLQNGENEVSSEGDTSDVEEELDSADGDAIGDSGSDGEMAASNSDHSPETKNNDDDSEDCAVQQGDVPCKEGDSEQQSEVLSKCDDEVEKNVDESAGPESAHSEAGEGEQPEESKEDTVVSETPEKIKKNKKSFIPADITPRRSSRNINRHKSYAEKDLFHEATKSGAVDDEVEEVTPTDPLADEPKGNKLRKPIVVSDAKGLAEFAASSSSKSSSKSKKEPTLVIIDTNSILSGKGPIPISSTQTAMIGQNTQISLTSHPPVQSTSLNHQITLSSGSNRSGSGFSVLPITLPSQTIRNPPQIKPIVIAPPQSGTSTVVTTASSMNVSSGTPKAPVILPSLTDDMFVVEAPSFIVPYVYEKPPIEMLKTFIEKVEQNIKNIEEKKKAKEETKEVTPKEKSEELEPKDEMKEEETVGEEEQKVSKTDEKADETPEGEKEPEKEDEQKQETDEEDKKAEPSNQMEVDEERTEKDESKEDEVEEVKVEKEEVKKEPQQKEPEKKIESEDKNKKHTGSNSYFDNPLGKFFMQIGLNLVQEHVQTDLLRSQKRKREKEGVKCSDDTRAAIDSLSKTLEFSKENNDPYKLELTKCELCSFKTESALVMTHHLETPHMKNYTYRCNFCPLEVRSPHDILFHMEAEHNVRGRLERAPAFHQCPNCPFEDNQKGKLTRHLVSCAKKYRQERNQEPPLDWEPPAKIPRVTRNRPPSVNPTNAVYQAAMSGMKQVQQNPLLPKLMPASVTPTQTFMNRNKPQMMNKQQSLINPRFGAAMPTNFQQRDIIYRSGSNTQAQVMLPSGFQMSGAQIFQNQTNSGKGQQSQQQQSQQGLSAAKLLQQPSISITPLPRQQPAAGGAGSSSATAIKPGRPQNNVNAANKTNAFVICEICDGYIKDLDQLRNHMQWIHKVKIHPKMIYNRPPLNCQKCQFRFFTDQGLERHLLGSHGLVTSSMQEAANKGKDGGRCPVCGRVYQWKLLNHVARDHNMALKPAHLSYKCTVCTATFGMYKQFESHVYSAHSVVAKRAIENKKQAPPSSSSSQSSDALLKPLKINDEITIIPQPARIAKPPPKSTGTTSSSSKSKV